MTGLVEDGIKVHLVASISISGIYMVPRNMYRVGLPSLTRSLSQNMRYVCVNIHYFGNCRYVFIHATYFGLSGCQISQFKFVNSSYR